jgi:hypothetical protein
MLFNFSVYALCMTEGINRMKFLLLMVSGVPNHVHLPRTLLVLQFHLGSSETSLCFTFVHFRKNCPSARCVKVDNSVCSNFGFIKKHINTLRFDIICSFTSQGVLINYSCTCVCFIHVLVTVRWLCMLCLFCYGPLGNSFRGLMNRIRTWHLSLRRFNLVLNSVPRLLLVF